ncbi:uncharacterized protein LOC121861041 [Homarus americanus]|uniref:uncharacterized protein LOC121861041 n=1 Tax=Homarus americanus TaxID=6706 RepID=UPI001C463743|nr:uncharacterized protein LOC121861041 [Homarus americanus]
MAGTWVLLLLLVPLVDHVIGDSTLHPPNTSSSLITSLRISLVSALRDLPATTDTTTPLYIPSPTPYPVTDVPDCKSWIHPDVLRNIPDVVARLPLVVSMASVDYYTNISLVMVSATGSLLACVTLVPRGGLTVVEVYAGHCQNGEAVRRTTWPSSVLFDNNTWPPSLRSHGGSREYFHIDVQPGESKTSVALAPNGDRKDSISVSLNGEAEFLYIFGYNIELAISMVSFHGGCLTTKCMQLAESVGWNQTVYFLPDVNATEVRLTIDYCLFFESKHLPVTPAHRHWHSLTFGDNLTSEGYLFRRKVFVDGEEVMDLNISTTQPPWMARRVSWCPLNEAKMEMEKAIWTLECDPTSTAPSLPHLPLLLLFLIPTFI